MPDHVEVELAARDVPQIQIRNQHPLLAQQRPRHRLAQRTVDRGPPAREHVGPVVELVQDLDVRRIVLLGDELVAPDHEAAPLERDVPERRLPAVARIGGGRQVDLDPLAVHGHARERHVVLPADQPADPRERRLDHRQRAPVPLAPDEAFGGGGFELAVQPRQGSVRVEVEEGTEEGARGAGSSSFDHADGHPGVRGCRCLADSFRLGSRHGDGGVVVAAEGASAGGFAASDGGAEGEAPWVAADEGFGEEDEFGALVGGLCGGCAEVVDGGGGVEGVAAGLDGGDSDVGAVGHGGRPAHRPAQGSRISIPMPSKSRTFRVATAMPRDAAIAAIWQSAGATGRPAARRTAAIFP